MANTPKLRFVNTVAPLSGGGSLKEDLTLSINETGLDHGSISGLDDDDHTQYHTDARGDLRYSQLGHEHDASDISSGIIDTDRLGTGTADSTTFLRGDSTWVTVVAGEANTASNVGTAGVSIFKTKSGVDLQFKKINAGSLKISITDDTGNDEVDIDVVETNLDHGSISGLSDDDHSQYHNDTRGDLRYPPLARTISTTAPLAGGGDLSANRTLTISNATTTAVGVVELATDGENASNVVVQGNDSRLSDARTPTAHTHGTADIDNDAVTYAKMQNVSAASKLLGRGSAGGAGDTEEIAVGSGLSMSGTTLVNNTTSTKSTVGQTHNTTTPTNATNLSFSVTSGQYYHYKFIVVYQTTALSLGIRFTITHPGATCFAGTVTINGFSSDGSNSNPYVGAISASGDAVISTAVEAANTDYLAVIEGIYLASASGTLQLQFGTETGVANVTLGQGSCGFLTTL